MAAHHFVLVTSSFPIRGDGSEAAGSFVADLAEALGEEMPVRVVAPGPQTACERWSERVDIFRYAAPPFPLSTLKPWFPSHLRWIWRVLSAGQAATQAATDVRTKHILALWGLPCGEWARRAARAGGLAYSTWMLGSDVWSLGRLPVLRGFLARVVRESAHAYADGYQLAEDVQRIAGRPVGFLPSARDMGWIEYAAPGTAPPYRLLFLGRWHPNKGIDLLLDALWRLTPDDWTRIECVEIHGGGPMDALVRAQIENLRAIGRPVEVGGFLDKSGAKAAMVRSDWMLIPSRIESIPLIFSDAMKMRRPVIATPVGDLRRLLAQESVGVCSESVDAEAYAVALRKALSQEHADRLSAFAKMSERFDLRATIVPEILKLSSSPSKVSAENG